MVLGLGFREGGLAFVSRFCSGGLLLFWSKGAFGGLKVVGVWV